MEELTCTCGAPADFVCAECGRAECVPCHSVYEVPRAVPSLCWRCQAEADREWLRAGLLAPRRTVARAMWRPEGLRERVEELRRAQT